MAACLLSLRVLFQISSVDSFLRSVRSRRALRSSKSSATDEIRLDDRSTGNIDMSNGLHFQRLGEQRHVETSDDVEVGKIRVDRAFELNHELKDEGALLSR